MLRYSIKGKRRFSAGSNQRGFSLIEMIAVLVLLGVMGSGLAFGLSNIISSFVQSRDTAAIAGKAQLAILRISRELRVLTSVSSASATAITFAALHDSGVIQTYTVSQSGDAITLNDGVNNDVLVDTVNSLSLAYFDTYDGSAQTTWAASRRVVQVTITMKGPGSTPVSFTTRVMPRNL